MIPNIRAVAIDDIETHLNAISLAAETAKFTCRKVHYPDGMNESVKNDLQNQNIRLVVCDLYLGAQGALAQPHQTYGTVAGVIENIGLMPWNPYVLVIWSKDAREEQTISELKIFLETRLSPHFLPCAFVTLDKTKYGIPDGDPTLDQQEALWLDLREKIKESRGVKLILQWETELLRATGRMVCKIIQSARKSNSSMSLDDAIDSLMTCIAQNATSAEFAKAFPRISAAEGLLPLLSDEMQHQQLSTIENDVWRDGMVKTVSGEKQNLPEPQRASLNTAFHISLGDSASTYIERGSVFECSIEEAKNLFDADEGALCDIFGLKQGACPQTWLLRLIQLEGACDAAQRKPGVVPLIFAAQLEDAIRIKSKGAPVSVVETPSFIIGSSNSQRLVANVRYFFTISRTALHERTPLFRIRESVVSKLAFAWANHTIRPGIVQF